MYGAYTVMAVTGTRSHTNKQTVNVTSIAQFKCYAKGSNERGRKKERKYGKHLD